MAKNKQKRLKPITPVVEPPKTSILSKGIAWLCLAWAGFATWSYWNRFTWMTDHFDATPLKDIPMNWMVIAKDLYALFLMTTLLLGACAFGSYLWRLFKVPRRSAVEEAVFSAGLGLGALGYLIFGLGLLQLFHGGVFWAIWVLGLVLAWRRWGKAPHAAFESLRVPFSEWHKSVSSWWLAWMLLWLAVLGAVVMCFIPEIFYDAMVYHLGVPRYFLHEGGIRYYPSIHAQFPFLRQMLNVIALGLEDYRLAKLLHWSSAPLILATYYALAERYSRPHAVLIAGLALFSMPMVQLNLWTSGVDVGLTFYTLLAFLAWLNGLTEVENRKGWMLLSAVFGGFCFASKYPGLISVVFMSAVTVIWLGLSEKNWRAGFLWGTVLSGVAVLVASPWLIKNWVFTGNPVYPYLFSHFGGRDLLADRLHDFTSDTGTGAKTKLLDLLKTPWTETLREVSSLTAPGVFTLAFLGYLLVGVIRKELREKWYWAGFLFFAFYWFTVNAMTDRLRLAIPGLSIGCFLLGAMASSLYARAGRFYRFLLATVVVIAAGLGLRTTWPTVQMSYDPWNVLTGRETELEYLSYSHSGMDPHPMGAVIEEVKKLVPMTGRVLIVGDEKVSFFPRRFIASGVHNDSPLVQWSKEAKSADELAQRFEKEGVTHVLLNITEAMRLMGYKILTWDDPSMARFSVFFDYHLKLLKLQEAREAKFNAGNVLALYEFVKEPIPTVPSENYFLDIYEEQTAPAKDADMAQRRRKLSESLISYSPNLITLRQRAAYWQSKEAR